MSCSVVGSNANLFRIPQFIAAPTKERLVRLMLINNLKHQIEFRYFNIQKDGNQWIAWFNFELSKNDLLNKAMKDDGLKKEVLNGTTE